MTARDQNSLFSDEQHELFKRVGHVRLEGAVPRSDVGKMYERTWALLEAKGIQQGDCSTWPVGSVRRLHDLKKGEPRPQDSPVLGAALDAVFTPRGYRSPSSWGQPLVTFPMDGPWLLPTRIWHFDHSYFRRGAISGVNLFLFVDDVEPGGGGTVVVESSPRLMDRLLATGRSLKKLSNQNRAFLRSHPWLSGLRPPAAHERSLERNHRYMEEGVDIDGIPARVVELTGKAGDVFLCHPALCHAPAPNVADRPRLMRTQRVRALPEE